MFDTVMERLGRKSWLTNFHEQILMVRYHGLYYYDEQAPQWYYILPNVYVHHMPGPMSPDAKYDSHRHPANAYGLVLCGGYTEVRWGWREITYRAGDFTYLPHDVDHRVSHVLPNTWTIWILGWRKQNWMFDMKKCTECCQACATHRGGQCFRKDNPSIELSRLFDLADGAVKWSRVTPEVRKSRERRLAALAKRGIQHDPDRAPAMMEERFVLNEKKESSHVAR